MRTLVSIAAASALALVLGGCGGGRSASTLPSAPSQLGPVARSAAIFTIRIPAATKHAAALKPNYLSPSTTQMALDIQQGGVSISGYPTTVSLTPTSTGCSSTLASTICQLTISLAPGSYTASLTMMDASSNVLSAAQSIAFSVVAGSPNAINIILNGVPHSVTVSPGAYPVRGTQNGGMTLYGSSAQKLIVNTLDADGNVIVGPGAPTYTVSVASGSGWSVASPGATTPNTFTVTPPGTNGSYATVSVSAAFSDGTCSTSGAVCSTTVGIKNDVQTLYVLSYNTPAVSGYALPVSTGVSPSVAAFNGGHFTNGWALALDPFDDVFVADPTVGGRSSGTSAVYEYSPAGTYMTSIPSTSGINSPWGLAFDRLGDLFVANEAGKNVTEYPPPYTTTAPVTLSKGTSGTAMSFGVGAVAFDSHGNLFAESANSMYEYAPPFASANNATFQSSMSSYYTPVAFDQQNNLYALDTNGNLLKLEASLGYSSINSPTIFSTTSPGPEAMAMAVDENGNVFVAVCGACGGSSGDAIKEYSASGTLLASFSTGVNDPYTLALDGAGNLYVANCPSCVGVAATGNVVVYSAPFTSSSTPVATLNDSSINGPTALAITP